MKDILEICSRFYTALPIPLSLVGPDGVYRTSFPEALRGIVLPVFVSLMIEDFRNRGCDEGHPLINYVGDGFFVGIISIGPELFIIVGLASSFHHSQKELLAFGGAAIRPDHLQIFCNMLMDAPIVTLAQLRSFMCLLTQAVTGLHVTEEDILCDGSGSFVPYSSEKLDGARFVQRESVDLHAATNFENGFCDAIALGRKDLLMRSLSAPPDGSIGMMSPNELRQRKYTFISFATLVTRAAIRGGLPEETAFLLSDIYCQRMDILKDINTIDKLTLDMAVDFCEKVAKSSFPRQASPVVQKALSYITVHLHESFGMDDLSKHCGLCRRSLSMRFQEEIGMTVSEYVQKEKTEEAKYLLIHTGISPSEIAAYLNYSSQSYFIQQFKKQTGETPERFRARIGRSL